MYSIESGLPKHQLGQDPQIRNLSVSEASEFAVKQGWQAALVREPEPLPWDPYLKINA